LWPCGASLPNKTEKEGHASTGSISQRPIHERNNTRAETLSSTMMGPSHGMTGVSLLTFFPLTLATHQHTETLNPLLNVRTKHIEEGELDPYEDEDTFEATLRLIFFDGEEAFMQWTETPSTAHGQSLSPIPRQRDKRTSLSTI